MKTLKNSTKNTLLFLCFGILASLCSCTGYSKSATRWHYRHEFRQPKMTHHTYHASNNLEINHDEM